MNIHHMSGLVVGHSDILFQRGINLQMIKSIFRGEVGCSQIKIPIGDEYLNEGLTTWLCVKFQRR